MSSAATAAQVSAAVAAAVAAERLRIVAGLIGRTGDWELAEDSLHDAAERALARWPRDGVPDNPAAWLTTTARRRAVDVLRRRGVERTKLSELTIMSRGPAAAQTDDQPDDWPDDRLKLIFTCCHPALPMAGRVALTLKTVAGLSTASIATSFLTSEATVGQRILRARTKISNAGIPYRVPDPSRIADRVDAVLAVIYLIFTEGYRDPVGRADAPDPAEEAVRLSDQLAALLPDDPEVAGLQALLAFQHARRDARTDRGELVAAEDQDRSRFDRSLIERGLEALGRVRPGSAGRYRLQAEIAALHVTAPTAGRTDWAAVVVRYDRLAGLDPSPVIALNRAVAIGFAAGPEAGLAALGLIDETPELRRSHLLPAVRADLLRRLGRTGEAAEAYRRAITLAPEGAERRFLRRRADSIRPSEDAR